jgi:perosamine synthetase
MSLFANQIPLMKPWIEEEEWISLKEVLLSGWISQGPKVKEFEEEVCAFLGSKYAVATNACTSAMHLALEIAGVEYGDEVIVPNTTCMANVNAIKMAGAKPVFVDIDRRTFNLDPKLIQDAITSRTKVVLNVDQIGLPNDLDELGAICSRNSLVLIDDAATAFGAKYKGKYLGTHGYMTTFSFHPRKIITTGEGGMLITDNIDFAETARILRATGASVSDLERHKAKGIILQQYHVSGYNYRLTDIQAAIGLVQLHKVNQMLQQRLRQAEIYNAAFEGNVNFHVPLVPEYATPSWSSYCILLTDECKIEVPEILQKLAEKNISARYGIQPLHREPYFKKFNYTDSKFPESCYVAKKSFFIPIYPGLTESEQNYIIDCLIQIVK